MYCRKTSTEHYCQELPATSWIIATAKCALSVSDSHRRIGNDVIRRSLNWRSSRVVKMTSYLLARAPVVL